ncbi:adenosine 5'-monophosphoramidase HINT3-like [Brevipalpus obovatus]|uniref:adenosine 5'-monophosphoramidase HINT3-like n=1 Tax=Brevipalpus obovatus TaxID=246614 RepID=UPI003D9DC196
MLSIGRFYKLIRSDKVATMTDLTSKSSEQSSSNSDCVFCRIVSKEEPATIEIEDEKLVAFKDCNPAASLHILVIPKVHIPNIVDLNSDHLQLVRDMKATAEQILKSRNQSLEDSRLGFHRGKFVSVNHLHLHVIAPESELGFKQRLVFMKRGFWFKEIDQLIEELEQKKCS